MKTTGESKCSKLRLTNGAEAPRHRHGNGFLSPRKSEQGRRRRLSNTVAEPPREDSARGYLERRYVGKTQQAFLLVLPAYGRKRD